MLNRHREMHATQRHEADGNVADGGFTLTMIALASSCLKDIAQINAAEKRATASSPSVTF
jgi:hypothetical protein